MLYPVSTSTEYREASRTIIFFPALLIGYLVYDQVEKAHHQLMRKNPADFENDQ